MYMDLIKGRWVIAELPIAAAAGRQALQFVRSGNARLAFMYAKEAGHHAIAGPRGSSEWYDEDGRRIA